MRLVGYVASRIRPGVSMVYWHEPKSGSNVVQVQGVELGKVYTKIKLPDGPFEHLSAAIRNLGKRSHDRPNEHLPRLIESASHVRLRPKAS